MPELTLEVAQYVSPTSWIWRLRTPTGTLDTHIVNLDASSIQYLAATDLYRYCEVHCHLDAYREEQGPIVDAVGRWLGEQGLGRIGPRILKEGTPAVVRVVIPPAAEPLLYMPWELAHVNGKPLSMSDVSLVFEVDEPQPPIAKIDGGESLRVLAVFSLPDGAGALNLRQERYRLARLFRNIAITRKLAIHLRVLQYGVTRDTLRDILDDGEGWDLVHFSGHGLAAHLLLETCEGQKDFIPSTEIRNLLWPARTRLKLVTLSACLSAAATVAETRRMLGLDVAPTRGNTPTDEKPAELSALARTLTRELGCAVLAMRYPVGDEFATDLAEHLYDAILDRKHDLTRALQRALPAAMRNPGHLPLSVATPALFGASAASLSLKPPKGKLSSLRREGPGLAHFPAAPELFVGRVKTLTQASAALAPDCESRGVLFHGMSGGGKSACALELAWLFENVDRFTHFVWFKAPEQGADISTALANFAVAFETQVRDENDQSLFPCASLINLSDTDYEAKLPLLRKFLEDASVLLVLDNLESLVESGVWREPRWEKLLQTFLSHNGLSRTLLTSRVLLPKLPGETLRTLPVHALPADETVLLARQYPNLGKLIKGSPGDRAAALRSLRQIQGHPKLLELVESQAASIKTLTQHLDQAEKAYASGATQLDAYFRDGESRLDPEHYLNALASWTRSIGGTLDSGTRTLFHFLCCLEEPDRAKYIVEPIWPALWTKQELFGDPPDLATSLATLRSVALIDGDDQYRIHPGVAESTRHEASSEFQAAVDHEAAALWYVSLSHAIENEGKGLGQLVVRAGRSAAPYLIRIQEWDAALTVLERVVSRDQSPATLSAVIPMLQRIAHATGAPKVAGVLASALANAARFEEAEALLRDAMARSAEREQFWNASAIAAALFNLLLQTGRAEEALALIDKKKDYSRRAGLGPWSQLSNECQRLQALAALGRYQEVLDTVQSLRSRMTALPVTSDQEESADPWNVFEAILNTGFAASVATEQWEIALELNAEEVAAVRARGANDLELARTRANDYVALLRLARYPEARQLLLDCRQIFEKHGAPSDLGKLFSALANLESCLRNPAQAANHERAALRYTYLAGDPRECAVSHSNLTNYLQRVPDSAEAAIAHLLAAVVIDLQIADGTFPRDIAALARDLRDNPPLPQSFDDLCRIVEQVPGVRFRDLFAKLPTDRAKTGDEALAIVLDLARRQNAEAHGAD